MDTKQFDCVVAGGGMAGCFAALEAAKQGKKTALVEHRTYLGYEMTAKLRPWLAKEGYEEGIQALGYLLLPDEEKASIRVAEEELPSSFRNEAMLFTGTLKKTLLSELTNHGVEVYLMSAPIGIVVNEGMIEGIVIANKYGMQLLRTSLVLDGTEGGGIGRLGLKMSRSGNDAKEADQARKSALASYVIEFVGAALDNDNIIEVPESLGIYGNKVKLHAGKAIAGQAYAEFSFQFNNYDSTRECRRELENTSRQLAIQLIQYLSGNHSMFKNALIQMLAEESLIQAEEDVVDQSSDGVEATGCSGVTKLPALQGDAWSFKQLLELKLSSGQKCLEAFEEIDARNMADSGRKLGGSTAHAQAKPSGGNNQGTIQLVNGDSIELSECEIEALDDKKLRSSLVLLRLPDSFNHSSPAVKSDIFIAGGGTAGANVANTAAAEGKRVTVAESMAELGGTQTVGLVGGYYYGYQGGYTAVLEERVQKFTAKLYGDDRSQRSRLAKMLYYRTAFLKNGGQLYTRMLVCGCRKDENNRIERVIAADEYGVIHFEADIYIDSTGDGDLAAFSGESFEFGKGDLNTTQNYSQWDVNILPAPFRLQTICRDYDVINNTKLSELQRGYQLSHTKAGWYNFSSMLTVRDSRRIKGLHQVTLKDVLSERHYSDTIAIGFSDFDPHGFSDTIYGRLGFLPVHGKPYEVEIPLRACIPLNTSNLLICCRGISLDWEAANYFRMTADLQNLGYSIGLIAARLVETQVEARNFDVSTVQQRLYDLNIIPEHIRNRPEHNIASDEQYADMLAAGDENALFHALLFASPSIVPMLERAFHAGGEHNRLLLAKALAWYGSGLGAQLMLDELERLEAQCVYQSYYDLHPKHNANVKAGIIDTIDSYWQMNQLIVLLGLLGERRAIPIINRAVDHTIAGGPPDNRRNSYIGGRIDQQRISNYDRIISLCFAIKRMPDPTTAPYLSQLLDREFIGGYACKSAEEAGKYFYSSLLELHIAEALALCGGERGISLLTEYVDDVHYNLSEHAKRLLARLNVLTSEQVEAII